MKSNRLTSFGLNYPAAIASCFVTARGKDTTGDEENQCPVIAMRELLYSYYVTLCYVTLCGCREFGC